MGETEIAKDGDVGGADCFAAASDTKGKHEKQHKEKRDKLGKDSNSKRVPSIVQECLEHNGKAQKQAQLAQKQAINQNEDALGESEIAKDGDVGGADCSAA